MRRILPLLALSAALLASGACANGQLAFGLRIDEPPPPVVYRVPAQPGDDYVWIEGYWYPLSGRYVWHDGYWTRPPYVGAYWVAPYHIEGRYFAGHWEGPRGVRAHDHRSDGQPQRDGRRR